MKLENFRDLTAWKEGHKLVIGIYSITKSFPVQEQFGITNQMRRAGVSITSNVAEGFVRRGLKEKAQFYYMALGSVSELQNQLIISNEIGYLDKSKFETLFEQCNSVGRLLNGLIKSTQNR